MVMERVKRSFEIIEIWNKPFDKGPIQFFGRLCRGCLSKSAIFFAIYLAGPYVDAAWHVEDSRPLHPPCGYTQQNRQVNRCMLARVHSVLVVYEGWVFENRRLLCKGQGKEAQETGSRKKSLPRLCVFAATQGIQLILSFVQSPFWVYLRTLLVLASY